MPSLGNAAELLAKAERQGQELYEQGSGQVTQVDLTKLRYGATELRRYRLEALTNGSAPRAAAWLTSRGAAWYEDHGVSQYGEAEVTK